MNKKLLLLPIALLFTGCGTQINLNQYSTRINTPINIPPACRNIYNSLLQPPKVAIMRFNNNSNFGVATISNKSSNKRNYVGISFVSIGVSKHSNSSNTKRVVDPKLDKAITSSLESMLASLGGVDVYSREDLYKVIKEQKLQQSGLFDENSLVKLGKLTGVRYIITGSIDGVIQEYKDYTSMAKLASAVTAHNSNKKHIDKTLLKIYAMNISAQALSGMKITTMMTFKVIDIETGKILFSKSVKESKNIGNFKHPTYSQIIGAIKYDIIQGLQKIKPSFSQFFAPQGYILQVRTDKKHKNFIAQINLGSKDHIKPEQQFNVYQLSQIIDPVTRKATCDKSTMDVTLTISKNQLQAHRSWATADGNDAVNLRPGQIVKRKTLKNSIFF